MENRIKITRVEGIKFSQLLTVIFITLKLCNVIDWPWIWVLSPLWIPFVIIVAITLLAFSIAVFIGHFHKGDKL